LPPDDPKKQLNQRYTLQMVSGETFSILEEVFLTLTLVQRPLEIWVFITRIPNECVLGLDVVRTYSASVDLGRQMLPLAEEEVLLWSPGMGSKPSFLVVASDQVIPAQCEVVVMAH
jgi:hypothetical protein